MMMYTTCMHYTGRFTCLMLYIKRERNIRLFTLIKGLNNIEIRVGIHYTLHT